MTRLADLEQLQDGWNGPGSKAVHSRVLANYALLVAAFDSDMPADLEPMAWDSGDLCLEWDRGDWAYSADIRGDGGMYLCMLRPNHDDSLDEDRTYPRFDAAVLKTFYDTGRIETR